MFPEGERYSAVFFSISQYESVPMEHRAPLLEYPTQSSLGAFDRLLAPPRGCDRGRQQSIWEAFGYTDKAQSLCWPKTKELPKEALVCIQQYSGRRFAKTP